MSFAIRRALDTRHCGPPIRSNRFFKLHDYWYFMTREGMAIGPYDDLGRAKKGEQAFIDFVTQADQAVIRRFFRGFNNTGLSKTTFSSRVSQ